ncbi:hypothetical protein pipiens_010398, partial [Culex pipiens pipiens]
MTGAGGGGGKLPLTVFITLIGVSFLQLFLVLSLGSDLGWAAQGTVSEDVTNVRQKLTALLGLPPVSYEYPLKAQLPVDHNQQLRFKAAVNALRPLVRTNDEQLLEAIRDEIIKAKITSASSPDEAEPECILGRAHHYLAHWLNVNGSINTANTGLRGKYLDLSNNVFLNLYNHIKPFLRVTNNKKLVYLSMANSGINSIPSFELTLVNETLAYFSLMGNTLTSSFVLPELKNLLVLDVRRCNLFYLPNNAFANTPNLEKLFLAHNSLIKLRATHFTHLSKLRHLDLSYITQYRYSSLSGYGEQDPYTSLTEGFELEDSLFDGLGNLSFLDLSHTKLLTSSARAFQHLTVKQLSLCYTGIPILVGTMMRGTLQVLDISGNPGIASAIHHDKTDARGFNGNLEILVCENSTVKHLTWLSGMTNLRVLMLASNNINQLTNNSFANMANLEILDLSSNHISNWHQRVFEANPNIYILDLSDNNINVLTNEMLYDFANVQFLAIGQNNFVCHCLWREFIELAAKNAQSITCLLNSILNQLSDPSKAQDEEDESANNSSETTTIKSVPDRDFSLIERIPVTEEPPLEMLEVSTNEYNVLFRVVHSYVSTIYDSSEKFLTSMEKYNLGRPPLRVYRKMVEARVNARFRSNICSEEPASPTDPSTTTTIAAEEDVNPLNGLKIQIIDFDEDHYKCIDLDDSEFYLFEQERCTFDRSLLPSLNLPTYNGTTANIIKFTLIFFGFALIAFIIYISKWDHVKYFCIIVRNATILSMMKHKNESMLNGRKESLTSVVSGGYMYDVFVSYSEQDRQWVLDELLPNMEKTEDINVCLHERDFE